MSKVRVAVIGSVGKSVLIDDSLGPRMDALEAALAALAAQRSTQLHANLSGLQTGNDHPQYPLKFARETIKGQWDFTQQVWATLGTEAAPGYAFTAVPGSGLWAAIPSGDQYFPNTVLLVHCDGANGSTAFTDVSPAGNTITPSGGGQVTTTNPKFGTGALLGNTAGFITAPSASAGSVLDIAPGDFTIEFWMRVTTPNTLQGVFDFGDFFGGTGFRMYVQSGLVTVQCSPFHTWSNLASVSPLTANTWYHFAIVRSGNTGKLYLNGVLDCIPSADWIGTNSFIGNVNFGTCVSFGPLGGALDDIRVTKGVARYTANFAAPTAAFGNSGDAGYVSLSVATDEKYRFGALGQIGIGGATYGTLRQSFLSGGPGAPATWSTLVHTDISDWDEAVQDTVGAFIIDSSSVDFTYSDVGNTLTAAVITANPSGLIGMTAVNGTAATPPRSDGRHAIDPAIAPTWTGTHTFTPASGNTKIHAGNFWIDVDNLELQLGAGTGSVGDLRLYHDGTNSIVRNDTGILKLQCGTNVGLSIAATGALSSAQAATWSGTHTFTSGFVKITATNPTLRWTDPSAALDEKTFDFTTFAGDFYFQAIDDALAVGRDILRVNRTGVAVAAMLFGNTTDNPSFTFRGTGSTILGGVINLKNYTVATLPAGTIGDEAYVTDALAPTFNATVAAGGAVKIKVFYNGTNWVT